MMDPWGRELFLICLLAAFCSGLAWVLDHELFAAAFAAAAVVAGPKRARGECFRWPHAHLTSCSEASLLASYSLQLCAQC